LIKKFLSEPNILEQMSVYVSLFGRKPNTDPLILASQVADIDQKMRNSYKALAKSNFKGAKEHFDNYTKSSGYAFDENQFVKEQENKRGASLETGGNELECFDAVAKLTDAGNTAVSTATGGAVGGGAVTTFLGMLGGSKGGAKKMSDAIKKAGAVVKLAKTSEAEKNQAITNEQSQARLSKAKADAIASGVPIAEVNSIVSKSANKPIEQIRNLNTPDTARLQATPITILEKVTEVANEYKENEKNKEIGKMMPYIIGVLLATVVITYFIVKK
jgi:hypothetical protein